MRRLTSRQAVASELSGTSAVPVGNARVAEGPPLQRLIMLCTRALPRK